MRINVQFTGKQIRDEFKAKLESSGVQKNIRLNVQFNGRQIASEFEAAVLRSGITKKPLTIPVKLDVDKTALQAINQLNKQAVKANQKLQSDLRKQDNAGYIERKKIAQNFGNDLAKLEAQRRKVQSDELAKGITAERKADAEILKGKYATEGKIEVLREKRTNNAAKAAAAERALELNIEREQAASIRRRDIAQTNFRNKQALEAQKLNNRIIVLAAQQDAKLSRVGSGSGLIRFGEQLQSVSRSLDGFDRVTSRVLRTTLAATALWSGGVVTALGAVAIAAETSFARVEEASVRAGAVFTSDQFSKQLEQTGRGFDNFADRAEASSKRVRQASNEVALSTLFNPTEIAQGAQALAQAGLTQEEVVRKQANGLNNLGIVARFAQNEQIDLAEATEKLTGSAAAAGLGFDQLTSLTDKFTFAANATNATANEIADAFSNQAAGAFRAYGQSVDSTIATISLFAKANLRGLEAGTQTAIVLREINNAIANKAPEAFAKYGIAIRDAQGQALPFEQTLAQFALRLGEVQKAEGAEGVARFRKELGLTEKSLRGLIILTPVLQKLGTDGVTSLSDNIGRARGATERQSEALTRTLSFQFGNLVENIQIQFQKFGEAAAPSIKRLIDQFNGSGGLFDQLSARSVKFGQQFGEVIGRLADFVQSPAFFRGLAIFEEAIKTTVAGVAETFRQFALAFGTVEEGESTFVAFAKAVRAFAEFSAATLPKVARIIGELINFLIENKDAFAAFAQGAVVILALKKTFDLFVAPVIAVGKGLLAMRGALTQAAAASNPGPMVRYAEALGLVDKRALGAARSLQLQAAAAREANAASLGTPVTGRRADARRVGERAVEVAPVGGIGGRRDRKAFGGSPRALGKEADEAARGFGRLSGSLGKAAGALKTFGKAAGLLGAVLLIPDVISGFSEQFKKIEDTTEGRTAQSFRDIGKAIGFVGDVITATGRALGKFIAILVSLPDLTSKYITKPLVDGTKNLAGNLTSGFLGGVSKILSSTPSGPTNLSRALDTAADSADRWGEKTRKAGEDAFNASLYNIAYATSVEETGRQNRLTASLSSLAARGFEQTASAARLSATGLDAVTTATEGVIGKNRTLNGVITGFGVKFASEGSTAVNAIGAIGAATVTVTAQLLGMQGALQAAVGEAANAQNSIIGSGLQSALSNAKLGIGPFSVEDIQAQIRAQAESERQARLIAGAKRARADSDLIAEALGTKTPRTAASGSTKAAKQPPSAVSQLPNLTEEAQAQVDALKATQRIKIEQSLIAKVGKTAGDSFKASRFQVALLQDAMPGLDKAIERQQEQVDKLTESVSKLDDQLDKLKNTQLAGSKAFSDQEFANDQAIKRLQLQRLDLIQAGNKDDSSVVKAVDDQIAALQTAGERLSLQESLTLDPQRRQLEQTFNPQTEAPLQQILQQFNELTAKRAEAVKQQEAAQAVLAGQQERQKQLQTIIDASNASFEQQDRITRRAAEAADKLREATQNAIGGVSGVGAAASGAASGISKFTKAAGGIDDGGTVVSKAAKTIADKVVATTPAFRQSGAAIIRALNSGVQAGATQILYPGNAQIIQRMRGQFDGFDQLLILPGKALMGGFLDGIKQGFGTPKDVGTVAWYLNVFIPNWIRENKGPVEYDRTILVPAGQAVMDGFGQGLRSGFSQIQSFVKEVGPSLREVIGPEMFSGKVATFMADIAVGKTPDIDGTFGDLRKQLEITTGGAVGVSDPLLQYLHRTLSLKDTQQMAASLAKTFGGGLHVSSTDRAAGTLTSAGNLSAHTLGSAADIGTGGPRPTAASLELFEAAKKLLGPIFRQVIHNGTGLNAGGGSFGDSQHFDHVHLEWVKGLGFDKYSGKIGKAPTIDIPGASDTVDAALNAASKATGVELAFLAAVARAETGFNPRAVSPAGAQGLMQLMPATGRGFGVKNAFDPFENALGGAKFLRNLLNMFSGRYNLAAGGYNAGPAAPGLSEGKLPPYTETQNYVRRVMGFLDEFRKQFGGFRAAGGPVDAGRPYVVGERGPELIMPRAAGTVIPADRTAAMLGSSGAAPQITYSPQISVQTASSDPRVTADLIDIMSRRQLQGIMR